MKCLAVEFPCQMNRAFSGNRIPSSGIRCAEELGFQAHAYHSILSGHSLQASSSFPACTAGSASHHFDTGNFSMNNSHGKERDAKPLSVIAQADLPGKSASHGRGEHPRELHFLS